MQEIDLQDLLEKYKNGSLNQQERALLETWYIQWRPIELTVNEEELEKIKGAVWKAVVNDKRKGSKLVLWSASIAAAILLMFSFIALYNSNKPKQQLLNPKVARLENFNYNPGGNKAILTLSNGKQISLAIVKSGKISDQDYAEVTKPEEGTIVYKRSSNNAPGVVSKTVFNSVNTPRGGQYHLVLSDGTQIWLNAASSVTFPVVFHGSERRVTINGEAYLEVAHNKAMPFLVSTGDQEIEVLGTHFNINGYEDDTNISTTLISGSVLVKNLRSGNSGILTPNHQSKIYRDKPKVAIRNVNANDVISWKNGYFIFDNQQISSIMKIISRWYDVDVEYRLKNKNERFGGTFSRSSSLSDILINLEDLGNIHFIRLRDKIIVTD